MSFSSWLQNSNCPVPPDRRRTQRNHSHRACLRPRVEALEDRSLPSGLPYPTAATVSQLIADINAANSAGGDFTVNLTPGATFDLTSVNNTIDGGNALPLVGGASAVSLAIVGNGDTIERVSPTSTSSNHFHLFDVAAGASLTLDNVLLREKGLNYHSVPTIAVYNHGTLGVSNCTASSIYGYIIWNDGGEVTVSSSNLSGNDGGAISNNGGNVTVSDCNLSNNLDGGGIRNYNGTLTISNSTLSGNTTSIDGGNVFNSGGTVAIDNSTISGGMARYGGGIENIAGTVALDNVTLTGNIATWHMDYPWTFDGDGGAIYNSAGTVTIDNCTVNDNGAVANGAGIYNDSNGTVTVENSSSIANNIPDGDNGLSASQDVHNLGVVYLDGTSTIGIIDGNPAIPFGANPPQLQIHDVHLVEGNTGIIAAQFSVIMSAASTQPVTVAYSTADGTATAGSDYQAASGTLTIPAGQTTGTITVLVKGDRLPEPNETFFVNLATSTNATISDGQGISTIVDDEPRISISDVSKKEGKKGQTTSFTFTVTLSAAYDQAVKVSYHTVDGIATTGDNDYVAKSGTLTFAPGQTTKTITINVKGDSRKEATEYFYLDLFGNSSNSLFTKSRGTGTILNDD
jgi:Calx-beta domain